MEKKGININKDRVIPDTLFCSYQNDQNKKLKPRFGIVEVQVQYKTLLNPRMTYTRFCTPILYPILYWTITAEQYQYQYQYYNESQSTIEVSW